MKSHFKEINSFKPLEAYGESEALWFESSSESSERWLREEIRASLIESVTRIAQEILTEKQKKVLNLFLNGKSQREIALELCLSRNSVKSCWAEILKKLRKNTTHLAYYWRGNTTNNKMASVKISQIFGERSLEIRRI